MGDLVALSDRFRAGGYRAAREKRPRTALGSFYLALLARGAGEHGEAAAHAAQAAERAPGEVLFREAALWLAHRAGGGRADVYEESEAFSAFVRGGGNVALYAAASERLRRTYSEYGTLTLLDVGPGDGAALLPALCDRVRRVDLVEPSESLLGALTAALDTRGVSYRSFRSTIQDFAARASAGETWDLVQATFSLQSLPPGQRSEALAWLAGRTPRLVLVEFDVPDAGDLLAPARVERVVERYRAGLREYERDRDLVSQGFLMPVLLGSFEPKAARTNHEQPVSEWVAQLSAAGYGSVEAELLHRYWWADAYFVDARAERLALARSRPLR